MDVEKRILRIERQTHLMICAFIGVFLLFLIAGARGHNASNQGLVAKITNLEQFSTGKLVPITDANGNKRPTAQLVSQNAISEFISNNEMTLKAGHKILLSTAIHLHVQEEKLLALVSIHLIDENGNKVKAINSSDFALGHPAGTHDNGWQNGSAFAVFDVPKTGNYKVKVEINSDNSSQGSGKVNFGGHYFAIGVGEPNFIK